MRTRLVGLKPAFGRMLGTVAFRPTEADDGRAIRKPRGRGAPGTPSALGTPPTCPTKPFDEGSAKPPPWAESCNRFAVNPTGSWAEAYHAFRLRQRLAMATRQRRLPTSPPNSQSFHDIERLRRTRCRTGRRCRSRRFRALFFLPFPPMGITGRLSELATEVSCEQRFS
jgi:hypothetical protein